MFRIAENMSATNSANTTTSPSATLNTTTSSNSNNSNQNANTSTSNNSNNNLKRYALVKWLENSQFDTNNEWLGRLTSVPHSNKIDNEVDDLKAGM